MFKSGQTLFQRFIRISDSSLRKVHNATKVASAIQEEALKENCLLVDLNDKVIGSSSKRDCHRVVKGQQLPLHRAFSVFLFNSKSELLVQKRSSVKVTFPNCYTNTCCSHPLYDFEEEQIELNAIGVKLAAIRRLNIELGVSKEHISPSDFIYLTRFIYNSDGDGIWGEHELDYILILKKDISLMPNPEEVSEVKYIARENFDDFIKNVGPFTPWFQLLCQHKKMHLWWDNLETLDNCKDHKNILIFE